MTEDLTTYLERWERFVRSVPWKSDFEKTFCAEEPLRSVYWNYTHMIVFYGNERDEAEWTKEWPIQEFYNWFGERLPEGY